MFRISIKDRFRIPTRLHKMAKDIRPKLQLALEGIGGVVLRDVQTNISGKLLNIRSRALYRSYDWQVVAIHAGWKLSVGSAAYDSGSAYARIHDLGGWTGRNHATHLKATGYLTGAFKGREREIDKRLKDYIWKLVK